MTATDNITALLAAVDSGDDGALGPMSDALEEAGDSRADGLRLMGDRTPKLLDGEWCWVYANPYGRLGVSNEVPRPAWNRLRGNNYKHGRLCYPTRSAALLALASVLVEVSR